ncbi:hypothetical protein BGZ65_011670 [Modicella reniformis]|uniref:Kelch repeat-containing protein n=1 Tax=Modicella reniformis TaxID=1440133 RepID=A0A9P6J3W3_9FUNG|nr:hypothetical protein BGZ65_011670 [Modicella reniformis]
MSPTLRSFGAVFLSALVFSTSFPPPVHAQSFKPDTTYNPTSTYVDGKGLYILGGASAPLVNNGKPTPKAFMIDLSAAWDASSPSFKQLPDGPSTWSVPSTTSPDGKSWFSVVNGTGYVFDIDAATWSTPLKKIQNLNTNIGLSAVTDPDTGIIYIPNGFKSDKEDVSMLKVDLKATKTVTESVPMTENLDRVRYYSASWSSSLKRLIFYTGTVDGLYSYSPSKGWKKESTKGDGPDPRVDACMVSAYGGNKMVMYGGYSRLSNTNLYDINILDVNTMTWTKGPDADSKANKRDPVACASSKNYFVAWSGDVTTGGMIYDLQTSTWSTNYDGTSSRVVEQYKTSGGNVPAVVGAVLGTLAVLFAIMAFIIYRKRSQRSKVQNSDDKVTEDSNLFSKWKTPSQFKQALVDKIGKSGKSGKSGKTDKTDKTSTAGKIGGKSLKDLKGLLPFFK